MENAEKRILVVDDDDAIRALLLTIFRRRGLTVDSARNGAEALQKLDQCRYTVMLLDLMMPIVNGWQVLEHLDKRDPSLRPVTIVLTAGTEPRDLKAELVAGSVRKPFDVELLLESVIACIAALSAREQLPDCPAEENSRNDFPKAH